MMDMSVSGGAAGVDAASTAKVNRPTAKGEQRGFSDALDKASTGSGNTETDEPGAIEPDNAAASGADAIVRNMRNRANAKPAPAIDLSDASLKAQADVKPETIAMADKTVQKSAKDQTKSASDLLSRWPSKDEVDDPDDEPAAHGVKNTKQANAGKTKGKGDTADDGSVADALDLLKEPADAAIGAATTLAAAAQAGQKTHTDLPTDSKSADPKEKPVDGVKSKGDGPAHVADALSVVNHAADDVKVPGSESTDAAEGRTFRISRADGRGQSMEMHIGADETASQEVKPKIDVENVTVLDSRRYLGLAQNSNSAAVTAALSGDSEWAQAMQPSSALSNAAEWTSAGKVVNTLKIQMNPIDLGLVTATMRLSGDALNVDLKVETGAAYRQLKEDHGKILEALRSQGYTVDNVTISMAPVDRSDAGNQSSAQGQSSQQQSLLQQGQGGEARERQNQSGQRGVGFDGAGATGIEDTSAGTAGGTGTGGVYL
jgi:chemotaxis protein MotD